MSNDPTDVETHFEFGRNWQNYVESVDEHNIQKGIESLTRILPIEGMTGKSLLDIGSGSGMTILSALNLGAYSCRGFDIDSNSVEAAKTLLGEHAEGQNWQIDQGSVFELDPDQIGLFDIVHSWGVLHHTGDMWRGIEAASRFTKARGKFILAIYRKTPFCSMWMFEKLVYAKSPRYIQKTLRSIYMLSFYVGLLATGRNPVRYRADYHHDRGMDWAFDVHDWMGGYPYESASTEELTDFVNKLGFRRIRKKTHAPRVRGLFGTHCDEFVFEKKA
jgi:SAM-dependent methyltransferase